MAVYLIVYVGIPTTIDGKATLAVASSLVKYGTPDMMVLGSAEGLLPPVSRMGSFGEDGLLYAKKGVVPSLLLLPLVALAHIVPGLPVRATAMLFNPFVTTLTALLLYEFARKLSYRPRTAFITALTYGVGTFAVIYTQTLFGEPLAALLLLGAVFAAFHYRQQKQPQALAIAGLLLGLLMGINITYGLMAPLVGLYIFGLNPRRWPISRLIMMIVPFAAVVLLLLVYNVVRFGSPFQIGYNFAEGEGFTFPFLLGLFGLTFSPYGGLFWFNPVLWLGIPGALMMRWSNRPLLMIVLVVSAAQLLTYASWWSWHGGIVWGPRFIIPITPLLVLLLLPIIDRIPLHRGLTLLFAFVTVVSVAVQLLGALVDFVPYTISLYDDYASGIEDGFFTGLNHEVIYRPDLSPFLGQIKLLQSGQPLQPALFVNGDFIHLLLIAALITVGVAILFTGRQRILSVVVLIAILATSSGTAYRQQHTAADARRVSDALLPAGIITAATTRYEANLFDLKSSARIITTNAPTAPDDPLAAGLWDYATHQPGLMWLITWFPPASTENWQERSLWQNNAFVRETSLDGERALLFDLSPPPAAGNEGGWQFGPVQLSEYSIERDSDGIRVTLAWQRAESINDNLSWFVHLIDGTGQIVQQQDRAPQGGYAPTSSWAADDTIHDYLFFPLSSSTHTTGWQIRIGYPDPMTGERLPVLNPAGEDVSEGFILLPVP